MLVRISEVAVVDDVDHVGDLGRHEHQRTFAVHQDSLGLLADVDRAHAGNGLAVAVLALFLVVLAFLLLFLLLVVVVVIVVVIVAGRGDLRHGQLRLLLPALEVRAQVQDAELRVVLERDVHRLAVGAEVERFRVLDGSDAVDELQRGHVDDVDRVPLAARGVETGAVGVEREVAGTRRGPNPLDDLVGLAVEHGDRVVLLAADEQVAGAGRLDRGADGERGGGHRRQEPGVDSLHDLLLDARILSSMPGSSPRCPGPVLDARADDVTRALRGCYFQRDRANRRSKTCRSCPGTRPRCSRPRHGQRSPREIRHRGRGRGGG